MILQNLSQWPQILTIALLVALLSVIGSNARSFFRLRHLPGPKTYAITRFRLAKDAWDARAVHAIRDLHLNYGPVVRVGPNQVSFNSLSALRTIYGAGSGFDRTSFYRMFDAYGRPNLFTFASGQEHRDRKKLLSHMYSNQAILGAHTVAMVQRKVANFLAMVKREPVQASEIFTSLHYFSFDAISDFVYGKYGATQSLTGQSSDRSLIDDILNPARRRLAWFNVHFPSYTKWLTTRTGVLEKFLNFIGLMPMQKPFTYSGIRNHALNAFHKFNQESPDEQQRQAELSVIGRLFQVREKQALSDMDVASECADHLLAGIDTTSDSLMFLIWALSLPQHSAYQDRVRREVSTIGVNDEGLPDPKDLSRLPFLNAVLRESLRLYSPLPTYEPRSCSVDTIIDGYHIPAGTIVGMSPYCLHREESVFPEPLAFKPERWLTKDETLVPESDTQNRWFWAFSSGARMCIGMHLANAEMLTLVAAVYRRYVTVVKQPSVTPGITSRFEVFYDECAEHMVEHECWVDFKDVSKPV